jgi:hypothetical protein
MSTSCHKRIVVAAATLLLISTLFVVSSADPFQSTQLFERNEKVVIEKEMRLLPHSWYQRQSGVSQLFSTIPQLFPPNNNDDDDDDDSNNNNKRNADDVSTPVQSATAAASGVYAMYASIIGYVYYDTPIDALHSNGIRVLVQSASLDMSANGSSQVLASADGQYVSQSRTFQYSYVRNTVVDPRLPRMTRMLLQKHSWLTIEKSLPSSMTLSVLRSNTTIGFDPSMVSMSPNSTNFYQVGMQRSTPELVQHTSKRRSSSSTNLHMHVIVVGVARLNGL